MQISCPFCGEACESTSDLSDHIEDSHQTYEAGDNAEGSRQHHEATSEHSFQGNNQSALTSSRKYECFVCAKRFETPSKVKRHLIVHRDVLDAEKLPAQPVKDYKYECEYCAKRVETPSKLLRHLRVHEKQNKVYTGINQHRPVQCNDCHLRFWDAVRLERHQVIHSDDFERSKIVHPEGFLFTCVICLHKLPSFEECIAHMKNHREDDDQNSEKTCQLCSKAYPNLTNLIRHSLAHEENATHQCIYCGKRLGLGEDLFAHLLRHQGFKPFVCEFPTCGKSFPKAHKLKQHMISHEGNSSKDFICGHCDKRFSELDYLKRHLIRHSGRKDHKCNICSAQFTFKSELNSHLVVHSSEKLFSCNSCSAKFSKKQTLKNHLKKHTGEVSETNRPTYDLLFPLPQRKFACDQCSMKFITSNLLRRHKLTHSGFKPFQCNHCGNSYSQSNDLIKHLRSHLGPNVYKCDFTDCQETFAKFKELKIHKASHCSADELMMEETYDIGSIKLLFSNSSTT